MRKQKEIIIKTVSYVYIGKDKDFNLFLKSVIRDYLSEDIKSLSGTLFMQKVKNKTA